MYICIYVYIYICVYIYIDRTQYKFENKPSNNDKIIIKTRYYILVNIS